METHSRWLVLCSLLRASSSLGELRRFQHRCCPKDTKGLSSSEYVLQLRTSLGLVRSDAGRSVESSTHQANTAETRLAAYEHCQDWSELLLRILHQPFVDQFCLFLEQVQGLVRGSGEDPGISPPDPMHPSSPPRSLHRLPGQGGYCCKVCPRHDCQAAGIYSHLSSSPHQRQWYQPYTAQATREAGHLLPTFPHQQLLPDDQ